MDKLYKCVVDWEVNNVNIKCTYCNKEFYKKPSQIKKSKNHFCSMVCKNKWQKGKSRPEQMKRVSHNCHYCKNDIEVVQYKYQQFLNGELKDLFCDRVCQAKWQSENWQGKNSPNYNSIEKTCENCNDSYTTSKSLEGSSRYCSTKCHSESRVIREEVTCDYCNTTFSKKPSLVRNKNFCDRECSAKWNSEFNNRQVEIECLICSRKFKVQRDRKDSAKSCSKRCHHKWLSEHYAKSEEGQKHLRSNGIKAFLNKKYSETKPERILKEFLIENNIEFIPQHKMYDKFVVDFYLPKNNMVIEVFGDYWHGNPLFYGDSESKKPFTERQEKQKKKDRSREAYLKTCGHKFHILWENDIYHKLSKATDFLIE